MDGDGLSAHVPLLTNKDFEPGYPKNTPLLKSLIKWVLKVLMWAIFVAWVVIIFILPTTFGQQKYQKWIAATKGTVFGHTGSTFLLFSGPVLAIAFLSVPYIIVSSTDDFYKKKKKSYPRFRLWTFPVLIDGLFGVVSAAELIGIFLFAAYIVWTVSYYTLQNYNKVTKFHLPTIEESSLMLEFSGLRFGSIGLFCLAFLFLPVARGSFLLRLIDIPFEHATRYHVWLGHLTMLIFTLHGIFYLVAWTMQHRLLHEMLECADIGICNLAGVISLLAGLLMWVTSLHFVRKEYFELFFYTHQLYVVFVVFLALHVGDFIFTIAAGGIFLFLLDRFLRFFQSRKAVDVISAKCLPCGTVEIVLSKPKNMRYNALSFIFLQVRELSWLQWHPFSVSSSPLDGENHISVLIKVLGEWTNNLRNTISTEEPMMDLPFQPSSSITASVEGPYGHESPYHLMYENLILVAGGIGISPFLAILRDILHRVKEKKPCLPEKVLIIWAVKKSNELSLLSASDLESICSYFSDKLDLEIQIYVTQESEPPLEEGEVHTNMESNYFPDSNRSAMSGLVGTGNNIWSGVYLVIPIIGFVILVALTDIFYINSYGIYSWWFKGLIFVACMIASVVIFGGLVVFCWHSYDECLEDDSKKSEPIQYHKPVLHTTTADGTFDSLTTTRYGRRPDFQELFGSISERWGHVDVGVIVCGPPTLQSSVARACRVQNIRRGKNHPFFHFNSHSFDL